MEVSRSEGAGIVAANERRLNRRRFVRPSLRVASA
jgi:hypothetical protein